MRRFAFAIALFAFACHATAQPPEQKKKTDGADSGDVVDRRSENGGKMQRIRVKGNTFRSETRRAARLV